MKKEINDNYDIQRYLNGIMTYAPRMKEVVLSLIGAILWRITDETILAEEYNDDKIANRIWFRIGKSKYNLAYNKANETIELKRLGQKGIIAEFNGEETHKEIFVRFQSL